MTKKEIQAAERKAAREASIKALTDLERMLKVADREYERLLDRIRKAISVAQRADHDRTTAKLLGRIHGTEPAIALTVVQGQLQKIKGKRP